MTPSASRRTGVKQKGQDLLKTANNAAARLRRKITMQEKELLDSKDRDKWRIYGELITANLYRMERGMSRLTAQNYYDPACKDIDIPLDVRLSPQENAAKYFKKYTKAKTAEKYLTEQLTRAGTNWSTWRVFCRSWRRPSPSRISMTSAPN